MSSFECVVLDFDGTFTDVDAEAAPFEAGYRADLRRELGPSCDAAWARAEEKVKESPHEHGWEYDGKVVAPANADPYIRTTAIAQLVLDEHELVSDQRPALLERLYRTNYAKSAVVFRPEAARALESLLASTLPIFVVTNSHTEAVSQKIASLSPKGVEKLRVFGDAKKYVITEAATTDARFTRLPESVCIDGLSRPIFLRRGKYFDVLAGIWAATGASPERTLLCGDIFELDLAMPARLGVRVTLVARPGTADYERRAATGVPRGRCVEHLDAVVEQALSERS